MYRAVATGLGGTVPQWYQVWKYRQNKYTKQQLGPYQWVGWLWSTSGIGHLQYALVQSGPDWEERIAVIPSGG